MKPKEKLKEIFSNRRPIDIAIEINGFTGYRTTLIDDLMDEEVMKLLSIHVSPEKTVEEKNNELKKELLRYGWVSKILKLAEETGIKEPNDFHKFNNWMYSSSIFKKHLNAHSIEELQKVFVQLQGVKSNNAKSSKKPMTKSWWEKSTKNINLN
ncbi:hypothetical protein HX126_21240 [Chryseobacterium indologenes]|uniref:hypothetical protein n=1 Tax=Chryseobacterium TaxID=59732 RepID=UPI00162A36C6|nr:MULTISPECIES: hypothetical protein [Chryseobacterium]MDM1557084.1 hypothetical protein [Chryseobacterium indologenes]